MVCANCPAGILAVPLNIRCSRKCASPDLPGVSSADPTRYQIMWVTTGVRWSGMTTTSRPLSRVKSETVPVWAVSARPGVASAAVAASTVQKIKAFDTLYLALDEDDVRKNLSRGRRD